MKSTSSIEFILRTIEIYFRGNACNPAYIQVSAERFGVLCMEQKVTNGKLQVAGVPVIIGQLLSFGDTVSVDANTIC